MSNLLERAIIDAKALKEAALKNAEQLVIEKYSQEVKQAVSQLLEVEEDAAMADLFGGEPDPGMADLDLAPELAEEDAEEEIDADSVVADIPDAFMTGDDEIIRIKLD